jgi:murein DD-endopeptidase MepM/ murein hydrolase activator NlpD
VVAVAPGRVIRVQRHGVGGLEVLIQHNGFIGVYSHLGLIAPILAEGAKTIRGGQRIATIGRSGLTYGPHLYFGMIVNGRSVDPAPYLEVAPCDDRATAIQDPRPRPTQSFVRH